VFPASDLATDNKLQGVVSGILPPLASNITLTHLVLGGNKIDNDSADYLAELLRSNHLISLGLRFNALDDFGVGIIGRTLQDNVGLCQLDLTGCPIGSRGVGILNSICQNRREWPLLFPNKLVCKLRYRGHAQIM